jgi:hypothetical protein
MRDLLNLLDTLVEAMEPGAEPQLATRQQTNQLAANLKKDMPDFRFEPDKKPISPASYVRIFGTDRKTISDYFASLGYKESPLTPQQSAVSGKYRSNILSYNVDNILYTLVVASSGAATSAGGVSVAIKEFTPVALGLADQTYNKAQLIKATRAAVEAKTQKQPVLKDILFQLIEVADGQRAKLDPELNQQLDSRSRDQLSVDFGEILAPIKLANAADKIEFFGEANFPLVDVVVGGRHYSVKSLTGSGTSFASIADLMDSYEDSANKDNTKKELFSLFKGFHPSAGGSNVDKIIRAVSSIKTPEYIEATRILGSFTDYKSLLSAVTQLVDPDSKKPMDYGGFLRAVYPIMTAGDWGKPVGLPADGKYYMNPNSGAAKPTEKSAGLPSYRANPAKGGANIITYAMGIGLLNLVRKGPNADAYSDMMTNIVNQSKAWLGKLDITGEGTINAFAKPFSELKFQFQYHAPSSIPGNNLPGFMIVM